MKLSKYTNSFYDSVASRADLTYSHIFRIFDNYFEYRSVKDVGCGNGAWLRSTLKNKSINFRIGYDIKSAIENSQKFENSIIEFSEIDLESSSYGLVESDLSLCLEVAEHLTSISAVRLINNLCSNSKYIIFSGATPGQGGYNHINEQEIRHWIHLFELNNFVAIDLFRDELKNISQIPSFYRNNILLFVSKTQFEKLKLQSNLNKNNFNVINSRDQIIDYRTFFEKIQAFILCRLNFKIVNILSLIKFYSNSLLKKK
jgi:2-polyprenyl-3-methyl-5-hydroxy-6-metoxy-1,4-benzoquinol methylase